MKAKISFFEINGDCLSLRKGNFLTPLSKLFLTLVLGLLFVSAMNRPGYMSFQTATESLEPASAARLQSLVTDVQPKAYLIQDEITISGEEVPVVAICDAASVNMLYGNNRVLSQVELVKFTASSTDGLPTSIDLTQLQGLTNLKYLLVEFDYDACSGSTSSCFNSILEGIIQGSSPHIIVMYSPTILK